MERRMVYRQSPFAPERETPVSLHEARIEAIIESHNLIQKTRETIRRSWDLMTEVDEILLRR
jgi:hypothetical protein